MKETVDPPTSPERSALMSKIRGKNTGPELYVRRLLHHHGYRFRLYAQDLPGRPDIVFRRHRKVIFIHGCFWHCHEGCNQASIPKVRREFWKKKFEANRRRDVASLSALAEQGWKTLVVWECETAKKEELLKRLVRFLDDSSP